MIEKGIISAGKILGAIVLIVSSGYGAYKFVYGLGTKDASENFETNEIKEQIISVLTLQQTERIARIKGDRKIDSLVVVFGAGLKQIGYMKVSQDSLKAYFIRKAVTKQDLQEVLRVFDSEKKNEYMMIR